MVAPPPADSTAPNPKTSSPGSCHASHCLPDRVPFVAPPDHGKPCCFPQSDNMRSTRLLRLPLPNPWQLLLTANLDLPAVGKVMIKAQLDGPVQVAQGVFVLAQPIPCLSAI